MSHSYAILGTGALGGLYGGLLANNGIDVHFLARSDYEYIRQNGLKVESPLGDFQLPHPNVYVDACEMPKVDVAIVAWKVTSNKALHDSLSAVCRPDTIVLVLQNGYDIERDSANVVGADQVLGGCCFLCCNKVGPGHIRHLDYGRIAFGEYGDRYRGSVTERMKSIESDFRGSGIEITGHDDLRSVRWKKLVWNVPFNGLSVALGVNTQIIMENEASRNLAELLMWDVCAAAKACGTEVPADHVSKMLSDTRKMVPYDSSMALDFRARRPIEVEAIFGNPLRAAQNAGFHAKFIEMLYHQLRFLDARNRSN